MKIYKVTFYPIWPVGDTFFIKAKSIERAKEIAFDKLCEEDCVDTYNIEAEEIDMNTEGIFFTSGDC